MGLLGEVSRIVSRQRPRPVRREVIDVGAIVELTPPLTPTPSPPPPPPSPPTPTPKTLAPPEGLDEEGLYVFHERVGIGLELGMTEEAAAEIAGVEAWLAHAANPRLREIGAKAIETFGGAWAVEVRCVTKEPTT